MWWVFFVVVPVEYGEFSLMRCKKQQKKIKIRLLSILKRKIKALNGSRVW